MMRGNRQGNNAFMEEYTHEFTSIGQQMDEDERMHVRIGYLNPIPMNALILISKMSKHAKKLFSKVWYHALRIGDREAASFMLEYLKLNKDDEEEESEEKELDISDQCI